MGRAGWIAAVVATLAARATAAEPAASLGVGAGADQARAVAALDLGLDGGGAGWSLALGARLRFAGDGLIDTDWDEPSELAGLIRYARLREPIGAAELDLAAGELGGVALGPGLIVAGYGSGVDADHGRLGLVARVAGERTAVELVLDDVAAPRFVAGRVGRGDPRDGRVGASAAIDWALPSGDPAMAVRRAAGLLSVDGELAAGRGEDLVAAFAEAGALLGPTVGVGLLAGGRGEVALGAARVTARAGLSLSSSHFSPGWFGPLYEIERRAVVRPPAAAAMAGDPLIDVAVAGDLAGLAPVAELGVALDDLGDLTVGHRGRPGLTDLTTARLAAPHLHGAQAALSTVVAHEGGDALELVLAAELRVRLPARLYATAELARLYHDVDGALVPAWSALATVGAVVGEDTAR